MITAVVQFPLPAGVTRAEAAALFQGSAPKYRGLPGLVRKYYLFGDGVGGGVYLWKSREDAERVYDAAWRMMIRERYGAAPSLALFGPPVFVDNRTVEISADAGPRARRLHHRPALQLRRRHAPRRLR